jgi:NarL family two-component system response regulator LiaR
VVEQQQSIRVLIVDDHLMVRYGLRALLATCSDIVVAAEAADGAQAVEICREQVPDVILMDIAMPNLDGPTATARIRAAFPHVQVIALTSFVDEAQVVRAISAGAIATCSRTLMPRSSPRQFVQPIVDVRHSTLRQHRRWRSVRLNRRDRAVT